MDNVLKKTNTIPKPVMDFFVSEVPMYEMMKSLVMYGLDVSVTDKVAGTIGDIFRGKTQLANLPGFLKRDLGLQGNLPTSIALEMTQRIFNRFPAYFQDASILMKQWGQFQEAPKMSEGDAWRKILETEKWIVDLEKEIAEAKSEQEEADEREHGKIVQMNIDEAMQKYPEVGEQPITMSQITLKSFPYPAKPSITNWIADYHENLGTGKHGSIDRGNYLFHNLNTKNLKAFERQKLGTILKSLDEKTAVSIDEVNKLVVFPKEESASVGQRLQSQFQSQIQSQPARQGQSQPHGGMQAQPVQAIPGTKTVQKSATPFGNLEFRDGISPRGPQSASPFNTGQNQLIEPKPIKKEGFFSKMFHKDKTSAESSKKETIFIKSKVPESLQSASQIHGADYFQAENQSAVSANGSSQSSAHFQQQAASQPAPTAVPQRNVSPRPKGLMSPIGSGLEPVSAPKLSGNTVDLRSGDNKG